MKYVSLREHEALQLDSSWQISSFHFLGAEYGKCINEFTDVIFTAAIQLNSAARDLVSQA